MVAAVLIVYLVLMLGLGVWCARSRIAGATDFLLAGRRLGIVLCTATLAATHFGGGAVIGGAAYGFEHGLAGAWYGISAGLGLLLLGLVTARRLRALSIFTVPDYLASRYGGGVIRPLAATLSLLSLTGLLAAQVNAARSTLGVFGIDAGWAALGVTLVFVVYTALGGLWAAAISDLAQLAIAATGIAIAAYLVLARAGGSSGLAALVAERELGAGYLDLFGRDASFVLWLLVPTVMYTLIGQDFYQRLFAAKSASVARSAAILAGIFLIAISFLPVVIGIGARGLAEELPDANRAAAWVFTELMHPALGALFLAAILAAVMSTADSLLTAAASHFVRDIWVETLGRAERSEDASLLGLSRAVTVVVGLGALAIGYVTPEIVAVVIHSYTLYTAGVFIPVMAGVLWVGATRVGALASAVCGTLMAALGIATDLRPAGIPIEVFAMLVSAVVLIVVSLVGRRR